MNHPTPSDFIVNVNESHVSVIFKPSDSYYSFGRLADPEDIARHGPLSRSPIAGHTKTGDTGDYPSEEVAQMAHSLAVKRSQPRSARPSQTRSGDHHDRVKRVDQGAESASGTHKNWRTPATIHRKRSHRWRTRWLSKRSQPRSARPSQTRSGDHHDRVKRVDQGAESASRTGPLFRPRLPESAAPPDFKKALKLAVVCLTLVSRVPSRRAAHEGLGSSELVSPYRSRSVFASSVRPSASSASAVTRAPSFVQV
jgi:hypothetical protein